MPTEELRQALRAANVQGAEKDFVDVICKLFETPRALVLRILYATQYATVDCGTVHGKWMNPEELPRELREAISAQVKKGWRRAQVRKIIEEQGFALAWIDALVPRDRPERICRGCPKSLDCVAESLSTPERCREGEGPIAKKFEVKPLKLFGDRVHVECAWPEGKYELGVDDLDL